MAVELEFQEDPMAGYPFCLHVLRDAIDAFEGLRCTLDKYKALRDHKNGFHFWELPEDGNWWLTISDGTREERFAVSWLVIQSRQWKPKEVGEQFVREFDRRKST